MTVRCHKTEHFILKHTYFRFSGYQGWSQNRNPIGPPIDEAKNIFEDRQRICQDVNFCQNGSTDLFVNVDSKKLDSSGKKIIVFYI